MSAIATDGAKMSAGAAAAAILFGLVAGSVAAPVEAKPIIGVALVDEDGDAARILRVRRGFPGAEAGLAEEDVIVAVNGAATDGAEETAEAIAGSAVGAIRLTVRRDAETLDIAVTPWRAPDPALDAELFPYASPPAEGVGTALRARVDGRDYEVVSAGAVFTLARSFNADNGFLGRRVAFRARVVNCDALAGAPAALSQPNSSPLYSFEPVQSLLFDPIAAEEERLKCEAYMERNGLDLSSPVVVIAGRLAQDEERVFSYGGTVLLVDAMLFDNNHVTLGEQVVGLVDFVETLVRWIE